ncbi:MAG: hypothetical protein K6G81_08870 [Lachnospiraceae bacterium]|nr:hypothetical protein [Lachnospiraceae bacterium]
MRRLINTFKYGSWKTRAFFGVIALALLGGLGTIAVAAIAGLGLIPIAVGGAAMVLGVGMSTMVTVVSDDKDKDNEEHENGETGTDADGTVSGTQGSGPDGIVSSTLGSGADGAATDGTVNSGVEQAVTVTDGKSGGAVESSATAGAVTDGKLGGAAEGAATAGQAGGSAGSVSNGAGAEQAGTAGDGTDNKSDTTGTNETQDSSLENGGIETIIAEDDGSYIPDIIVEEYPEKAVIRQEVPQNGGSSQDERSISNRENVQVMVNTPDQTIVRKEERTPDEMSVQGEKPVQKAQRVVNEEPVREEEKFPKEERIPEEENISEEERIRELERVREEERARQQEQIRAEERAQEEEYSSYIKAEAAERKVEQKAENQRNKEAQKEHIKDGREGKAERREEKREVRRKTGEYGEELDEKFENEMSFAEKEKLRENLYEKDVKGKLKQKKREEKKAQKAARKGEWLKKIGSVFSRLFANVHDELDDEERQSGSSSEEDINSLRNSSKNEGYDNGNLLRDRRGEEDSENKKDTKKKDKKPKEKKVKEKKEKEKKQKDKKDKEKKGRKKDKNGNKKSAGDESDIAEINLHEEDKVDALKGTESIRNRYAAESQNAQKEPAEPERERMPGDEIDVTRYTAGNMKKIIKANKIGKDFIPVFIENWKSKGVEKTPALCFVKDDRVHFLLLEGDMERNVSVPTDKFINVWYKRNVPETNIKIYQNMKEKMGAYEMFENVMPAFAGNTDQMGKTDYTRNLYLLGNDIAVAPPSMRELRKRFRFNTNIFDSLNTKGNYSEDFKKAYENRILWTDNVIGMQEYQRRIRAILQEMVNSDEITRYEFEEDVAKMVQYRLITDEYADFYLKLRRDKK